MKQGSEDEEFLVINVELHLMDLIRFVHSWKYSTTRLRKQQWVVGVIFWASTINQFIGSLKFDDMKTDKNSIGTGAVKLKLQHISIRDSIYFEVIHFWSYVLYSTSSPLMQAILELLYDDSEQMPHRTLSNFFDIVKFCSFQVVFHFWKKEKS